MTGPPEPPAAGSRPVAWPTAAALAFVEAVLVYAAAGSVFFFGTACGDEFAAAARADGLWRMAAVVAVTPVPWLVAAAVRRRWSLAAFAVPALAVALLGLHHLAGIDLDAWVAGDCR